MLSTPSSSTSNLVSWANRFYHQKVDPKFLIEEFKGVMLEKPISKEMEKNIKQCRYENIVCVDSTRVVLKLRPSNLTFIHANWVTMPNSQRYIATQGPMKETVADFLHMIVTEGVHVIVMMCRFVEDSEIKVDLYLPIKEEVLYFGDYGVRRASEVECPIKSVYKMVFEIFDIKTNVVKSRVTHFEMTQWPDHGVPEKVTSTLKLLEMAKKEAAGTPICVHCSAGVGRTGTFLGIEYGSQRLKQDPTIQPTKILKELRKMRDKSVQNYFQFMYMILSWSALARKEGAQQNEHMDSFVKEFKAKMKRMQERVAAKK